MCFLVDYKAVAMATLDILPHYHFHLESLVDASAD